MTSSQESDAIALWEDALTLLAERNVAPATLAMLRSCQAVSFDGEKLTVSTNMGFAQRKISQQAPMIEECLEQAAFQSVGFEVMLTHDSVRRPVQTGAEMSREEVGRINTTAAAMESAPAPVSGAPKAAPAATVGGTSRPEAAERPVSDFKNEVIDPSDSKLTFDRFVSGEENEFAFDAAKQVANGGNKSYNPLFIYGKSGLGKTHLLRAIQNYIAQNDPSRLCVYRTGTEFVDDYVNAMNVGDTPAKAALSRNYQNVDVLIIDDIQNMRRAAGTISFFFETYNTLMSHGKQIVLAADRSPSQLGMGDSKFDERETSRMDSGVTVSIQVPDYELKLKLINSFYDTMKQDAVREHIPGMTGDDIRGGPQAHGGEIGHEHPHHRGVCAHLPDNRVTQGEAGRAARPGRHHKDCQRQVADRAEDHHGRADTEGGRGVLRRLAHGPGGIEAQQGADGAKARGSLAHEGAYRQHAGRHRQEVWRAQPRDRQTQHLLGRQDPQGGQNLPR
jgi:chromosomal replication initiator protein